MKESSSMGQSSQEATIAVGLRTRRFGLRGISALVALILGAQAQLLCASQRTIKWYSPDEDVLVDIGLEYSGRLIAASCASLKAAYDAGSRGSEHVASELMTAIVEGDGAAFSALASNLVRPGTSPDWSGFMGAYLDGLTLPLSTVECRWVVEWGRHELVFFKLSDSTDNKKAAVFLIKAEGAEKQLSRFVEPYMMSIWNSLAYEIEHSASIEVANSDFTRVAVITDLFQNGEENARLRIHFNGGPVSWGGQIMGGPLQNEYEPAVQPPGSTAMRPSLAAYRSAFEKLSNVQDSAGWRSSEEWTEYLSYFDASSVEHINQVVDDTYIPGRGFRGYLQDRSFGLAVHYIVEAGDRDFLLWTLNTSAYPSVSANKSTRNISLMTAQGSSFKISREDDVIPIFHILGYKFQKAIGLADMSSE